MILITRPKPEAKKLKRIIENLGYHTHIDSLSTIVNLKIDINSKPKKIILISSQRAAKIIIEKHPVPLNMPLLVIGDISYNKLKKSGFSKILYKANDSNQLLKYLMKNLVTIKKRYGRKITYMTGSVSNQNFIKRLNKIGYSVEKEIIYKIKFKKSFNFSTVQLLKNNKIFICLIYSQQNAVQFCKLVANKNLFHKCKNLLILTLSRNITQIMKENGYHKVINSAQPTQTSLMKRLKKEILL